VLLVCCESSSSSADGHANHEEKKYDAWHHGFEIAERHRIQAESGVARLPFRRALSPTLRAALEHLSSRRMRDKIVV
jgi:hypothetical protein